MRVTYTKHSGFLVEWEDVACLFDCVGEAIPEVDPAKRVFVFASHAHSDHYDPAIFGRFAGYPRVIFILSSDIPVQAEEKNLSVFRMEADRRRIFPGGKQGALTAATIGSTDQGVAFVVHYGDKTIYHAGDLHWWAWPDDTPSEEREMKNRFFAEISKIKGMRLDAAFLPLDPRLGGNFWMGFDAFMRSADVGIAFPMHMWERYSVCRELLSLRTSAPYRDRIAELREPWQVFEIQA